MVTFDFSFSKPLISITVWKQVSNVAYTLGKEKFAQRPCGAWCSDLYRAVENGALGFRADHRYWWAKSGDILEQEEQWGSV